MKQIDVDVLVEWIENWFTKNRLHHPYAKNNNIPITELYDILEQMPAITKVVAKDINVPINGCISRQVAIDALYKMLHDCFWADDEELDAVITTLNELPSAQPEDCDTCKHGYFGNSQCENCRVRYPSHYERRTDETD